MLVEATGLMVSMEGKLLSVKVAESVDWNGA